MMVDRWLMGVASRGEVIYVFGLPVSQGLIAAAVVGLGALLPDIDEPNSIVSNLPKHSENFIPIRSRDATGKALRDIVRAVANFFNLLVQGLSRLIRILAGGHRGATHWLLAGAFLTLLIWQLGESLGLPLGLWFGIGYASHLVLDLLTTRGLKVLRPLSKRTLHLLPKSLRISTGNLAEQILRGWMILMIVWLLFTRQVIK